MGNLDDEIRFFLISYLNSSNSFFSFNCYPIIIIQREEGGGDPDTGRLRPGDAYLYP
jgi:hypothetical protein